MGGSLGMRYIVRGSSVVEHAATEGPLLSDAVSALPVSANLLQPKEI